LHTGVTRGELGGSLPGVSGFMNFSDINGLGRIEQVLEKSSKRYLKTYLVGYNYFSFLDKEAFV